MKPEKFQIFIISENSETGFMKVLSNELWANLVY